ncbi:MAG: glutathione synthase [Actinomycetota bacterium]|nr:glutathione synthase [Actinomycetota bacterium]
MKIGFFVNRVETEIPEYTTTRMAIAASRMGHEVWYIGAGDVDYEPGERLTATAHSAETHEDDSLKEFLERVQSKDRRRRIALDELDALMLRNDSIEDMHDRPWAMGLNVLFGQMLSDEGVTVVNDPIGLSKAASKLYLQDFPPDIRPRSLVTRDEQEIRKFLEKYGSAVIKPLYGAKGRNVFLVRDSNDPNLSQMVEAVLEDGYILAQEYLSEADEGDTRLFLLEGRPLKSDGEYAAFRRVPPGEDVRSNISTGGKSVAVEIGDRELEIARAMESRLVKDGMFFVGLDIVGDKVVEINAESPGGLQSVEHFTGIDFGPHIIEALEKRT